MNASPRIRLFEMIEEVRDSYWFVPGLLALGGIVAGAGLVAIDAWIGDSWLEVAPWLYGGRPEGARAMLSTIAGSTITVAGVVFSVTLAAVTYASGQHGPQLLTNFARDRGNQISLGVFVGAYLYCLVVLRTIHSVGEEAGATEAFVPHIAVYGALGLAVASTAVLFYFVHHVTESIHISNVIARIGHELSADIRRHADKAGEQKSDGLETPEMKDCVELFSTSSGYVTAIDFRALRRIAVDENCLFHLCCRQGDFLRMGQPIIKAELAGPVNSTIEEECNAAFALGDKRTPYQDLRFEVEQLVQIAARALSPGVNDPFTAMNCIDWLGAALAEFDERPGRDNAIADDDGRVRVVARNISFSDYLDCSFGQLRTYVAADPNARAHLLAVLEGLAERVHLPANREALIAERQRLTTV